jgi:hypothetical protein
VLIDSRGEPVLVDIEGLMFFDAEWEHAFLRIRFGSQYPRLARDDLDENRLALYDLALRLSLVAGPLRLLDGDYPDRAEMLEIAEYNVRAALTPCWRRNARHERTAGHGETGRRPVSMAGRHVGLAGFEPATSATQTRRASQAALQPVRGQV